MKFKFSRIDIIIFAVVGLCTLFTFQNCSDSEFKLGSDKVTAISLSSMSSASSGLDIKMGIIRSTAAGIAAGLDIEGRMMIVRDPSSGTKVYMQATGLNPAVVYATHLHDQACSVGGGAHYKIDTAVAGAIEANEFWPKLGVIGVDGVVSASVEGSYYVRPEGQSVVLHLAADNSRLACGGFYPQYSTNSKEGKFAPLAGGLALGVNISGAAVLIRNGWGNQTVLRVTVAGLPVNTTFMSHVHNQPCAMADGGVHYKQNASVTETVATAANEIWATLVSDATGMATARAVVNGHVARADAMSVVIHDPVTPTTRLACVDLATDGGIIPTTAGMQRMRNVAGTANIERMPNGQTRVTIAANGLLPNTRYVPHVHDRPCHIAAGGGHYKYDYSVAAAVEGNEIWVPFMTDAAGAGGATVTVNHLARPEAQSIVIHDPVDAVRLACVDIY